MQVQMISPQQRFAAEVSRFWWLPLMRGVFCLFLGGYALLQPGMTVAVLAQVVGIFVIADGVLAAVLACLGTVPSRGWVGLRGVLQVLAGAFVFANPLLVTGVTATVLLTLLAFVAIFGGLLEIVAAIQARKVVAGEGWLMLSGFLVVIFGVLVLAAPLSFGLLMVRVLGGFTLLAGVSLVGFAFRLRRLGRAIAG